MIFATIWQRILAFVIDLLVFLPSILIFPAITDLIGHIGSSIFGALITYGYFISLHALYGQTLGKRLMRIRVIRIDGERIGWREAALRSSVDLGFSLAMIGAAVVTVYHVPPSVFPFGKVERQGEVITFSSSWGQPFWYASYAWSLIDDLTFFTNAQGRTLRDMIAGTVVVKVIDPVA